MRQRARCRLERSVQDWVSRGIKERTALAAQYATNLTTACGADLLWETITLFLAEAPGDESAAENSLTVAFEKNFTAHRERSEGKENDKVSRLGGHPEYLYIYFGENERCL